MTESIPHYALAQTDQLRYFRSVDESEPAARSDIVGAGTDAAVLDYNGLSTDNLGFYRVENPDALTDRRLVILKNSYQNPTIDYFTRVFAEVVVIDPRSYDEPYSFQELLEVRRIDLVLLFYHQNNASSELSALLTQP